MRFQKRVKLMPGVRLNISKSGVSASVGGRGGSITVGKRGVFANASIPGTGLSQQTRLSGRRKQSVRREPDVGSENIQVEFSILDDGSASMVDSATGLPLPENLQRQARKQHRDSMHQFVHAVAEQRNEERNAILDIHIDSPHMKQRPVRPRPFKPLEPEAPVKPSLSLFTRLLRPFKTRRLRSEQEDQLNAFQREYSEWKSMKEEHHRREFQRCELFRSHMSSDSGTVEDYYAGALSELVWPRETLIDFKVSRDCNTLEIDIDMPEVEDLPQCVYRAHGTQLRILTKRLTQKQIRLDYSLHVHGIVFRVMSEAFACLPRIDTVVCSGYSQRRNRKTSAIEDQYLLSVHATRNDWRGIDFRKVRGGELVPYDFLTALKHRRKISATGIFSPVRPLEPS